MHVSIKAACSIIDLLIKESYTFFTIYFAHTTSDFFYGVEQQFSQGRSLMDINSENLNAQYNELLTTDNS